MAAVVQALSLLRPIHHAVGYAYLRRTHPEMVDPVAALRSVELAIAEHGAPPLTH